MNGTQEGGREAETENGKREKLSYPATFMDSILSR